jgi:hypothetical protein
MLLLKMLVRLEEIIMRLKAKLDSDGKSKLKGALLWPFHEGGARGILAAIER